MKMYLISDNVDTYTGMRLAGVDGVVVHERNELKKALEDVLADKTVGIVLLTEKFGRDFPDILDTFRLERGSMPRPSYVSLSYQPRTAGDPTPINQLPAGKAHLLFVHGQQLKLAGDDPSVGLTLRRLATGEEWRFAPDALVVNEGSRLCLSPDIDLSPGDWEVEVVTRYRPNATTLYKEPRQGSLIFQVR